MPRPEVNNSGGTTSRSDGLLKIIFFLHLILSSCSMASVWAFPTSFLYTNFIYMTSLLWAIASKDGVDAISMALIVNVISFSTDLFSLIFWPSLATFHQKMFFFFGIMNTILRPFVALILYRIFKDRDIDGSGLYGLFSDVLGDLGMDTYHDPINHNPNNNPISPRGSTSGGGVGGGYQNFEHQQQSAGPQADEANNKISNLADLEDLQQNSTPTFTYQTLA